MTLHYTDFSEYAADAAPSDWTLRFGTRSYVVRAVAGATGGKVLEITGAANTDFFSWDALNADANRADSEVLVRFRVLQTTTELRALQRGVDNAGKEGYISGTRPDSSTTNISKFTAGGFGDISSSGDVNFVPAVNEWWFFSSIVRGGVQELRVWPATGTRPTDPTVQGADTGITAAGWIGLYSNRAGTIEVDTFAVGTGADDAPTSAPTSDTTAPTYTAAPAVTATTNAGHTISAAIDEAGTIYAVRLASGATAPSSAQVKAGQDSTGAVALEAKSAAVAASTPTDLVFSTGSASTAYDYYHVAEDDEATPNLQASPTLVSATTSAQAIRKGSQFTIEETLAGTVVSATLNGNAITVDSHVGTTVTLTDSGSGIATSGEYPLVLTDDSATPQSETITLQVNVVGLPVYNLNKDGADLASLADVEVIVMTGAAGSRAVSQNTASEVTDVSGNTVAYEVTDTALAVDQNVFVVIHSAAGTVGIAFTETLELI